MGRRILIRLRHILLTCLTLVAVRTVAQPGNIDPTFNPGANDHVYSLIALADNRLLVGGGFWAISGSFQGYFARLAEDGSVDAGFGSPLPALSTGPVTSIAVQTDGKIIIAGQLSLAGFPGHAVMRLFADGTLDTNFVVTTDQFFFPAAVAVRLDGKVVVGTYETGNPPITRLNADGSRDTTFAPRLGGGGLAVVVLPGERCIVGGTFGLVRLNNDGSTDLSFGSGVTGNAVDGTVAAIARSSDGRLAVAGEFGSIAGVPRVRVARLTAEGKLDPSFDPGGGPDGWVSAVAVQADGK